MRPQPMRTSRGARFAGETLEHVPGNEKIRPLRDQIIVAPLEVVYSRYIYVGQNHKPLRGKVLAVGPGCYPKVYDHPEKHKRTKMWESKAFRPTEVRAGDTVELGGSEIEGYAFEQFWWGDELCLICREADVCFVS